MHSSEKTYSQNAYEFQQHVYYTYCGSHMRFNYIKN